MLANADLAAATLTSLYTCNVTNAGAAPTRTIGELSICNRNAAAVKVRVAIVTGTGNPGASNWIEYDRAIGQAGAAGNSPLTRSISLKPNQALWVWSDTANVTAVLSGVEE